VGAEASDSCDDVWCESTMVGPRLWLQALPRRHRPQPSSPV